MQNIKAERILIFYNIKKARVTRAHTAKTVQVIHNIFNISIFLSVKMFNILLVRPI